jgi:transcriptional repressor NrdR
VPSKTIGRLVLEKLKELDDVAYLRFASVYKGFGSAETFVKEAEKLAQVEK